jgi:hypothetical protein
MRKGRSPKITGSSVGVVIGLPERVKVEPLSRCLEAIVTQALGIAGGPLMYDLFAVAAFPGDRVGEGFEGESIIAIGLFQAQQQVDRAFQ